MNAVLVQDDTLPGRCDTPSSEEGATRRLTDAEWLRQLSPEKRASLRALHKLNHAWDLVILLHPLIWALSLWIMTAMPVWWVRVPCYVMIGASINAMVVLMHEAGHYALFRKRSLDRLVGFFMGASVFVSVSAYRVLHGYHHRYTRGAEDPDEFLHLSGNKKLLALFFYLWPIIGTPILIAHVPVNAWMRAQRADRRAIAFEYLLLSVMWGGVVVAAAYWGRLDMILHGWVFPMVVVSMLTNIRGWSEHAMTQPDHPLLRTRTVTSNRLVSFLMCNLNYHIEHHLLPGVPWYNLQKVHALLQDDYRAADAFVCKSYLKFIWRALRTGVHGMTHLPTM